MSWFWLSFRDPKKPSGHSFSGACLIEAADFQAAIQRAWDLECNPGGEVLGIEVPEPLWPFVEPGLICDKTECEAVSLRIEARYTKATAH